MSRKIYKRIIRNLEDEIKACEVVLKQQELKNFRLTAENMDLKHQLEAMTAERDKWYKIAHDIDTARRNSGQYTCTNPQTWGEVTPS